MTEPIYCEGCLTLTNANIICTFAHDNAEGQCPCTVCIIKMMCTEVCYKFVLFRYNVRPMR